jgi:hypothetical protein
VFAPSMRIGGAVVRCKAEGMRQAAYDFLKGTDVGLNCSIMLRGTGGSQARASNGVRATIFIK